MIGAFLYLSVIMMASSLSSVVIRGLILSPLLCLAILVFSLGGGCLRPLTLWSMSTLSVILEIKWPYEGTLFIGELL